MKKRLRLMAIAIVFLVVSVIGGSIAYFRTESDARNKITTGNLGVELRYNNENKDGIIAKGALPGSTYDYPVSAYNSGDFDSYVRMTFTKYWEDQRTGKKNFEADASKIELGGLDMNDWIIDDSDENHEVVYCYYKKPVASKTTTENVIDSIKVGQLNNKDQDLYSQLQIRLDVEVDAIQKVAAQDAILAEWGLDVIMNEDGIITQVEE